MTNPWDRNWAKPAKEPQPTAKGTNPWERNWAKPRTPGAVILDMNEVELQPPVRSQEPDPTARQWPLFGAPPGRGSFPYAEIQHSRDQAQYEARTAGTPVGVREVAQSGPAGVFGVQGAIDAVQRKQVLDRAYAGQATPEDLQDIKRMMLDEQRGATVPGEIAQGIGTSVGIMGTAAAGGAVGGLPGAMAGVAANPARIASRYTGYTQPQMKQEIGQDGHPTGRIILLPPAATPGVAAAKTVVGQGMEGAIEIFGGRAANLALKGGARVAGAAARKVIPASVARAASSSTVGRSAARVGRGITNVADSDLYKRGAFHGPVGEYGEEIGQALSDEALGLPGADASNLLKPTREAGVTAAVVLALGGPGMVHAATVSDWQTHSRDWFSPSQQKAMAAAYENREAWQDRMKTAFGKDALIDNGDGNYSIRLQNDKKIDVKIGEIPHPTSEKGRQDYLASVALEHPQFLPTLQDPELTGEEKLNAAQKAYPVTGAWVNVGDESVDLRGIVRLLNPNSQQTFDHEMAHGALRLFLTDTEMARVEKEFMRPDGVFDEELAVNSLQMRGANLTAAQKSAGLLSIMARANSRIRQFSGTMFGKSFNQIAEELHRGDLLARGPVEAASEPTPQNAPEAPTTVETPVDAPQPENIQPEPVTEQEQALSPVATPEERVFELMAQGMDKDSAVEQVWSEQQTKQEPAAVEPEPELSIEEQVEQPVAEPEQAAPELSQVKDGFTKQQEEVDLLLKRAGGDPKRALTLYQRQVATAANRGELVALEQVDAMYRALSGNREQMEQPVAEPAAVEPEPELSIEEQVEQEPEAQPEPEPVAEQEQAAPELSQAGGTSVLKDVHVEEASIVDINVSHPDGIQQFKHGSDPKTGVVEKLQGTYERTPAQPILVWERLDGKRHVITGRHRLDLAKRSGETTVPVQVLFEKDGFTKQDGEILDAEANIRDGQGSTFDHAQYFRLTRFSESEAKKRSLLRGDKARQGFSIGKNASDALYTLYKNEPPGGTWNDKKVEAIARVGKDNPALQALGVQYVQEHPDESADKIVTTMNALRAHAAQSSQTTLFGDEIFDAPDFKAAAKKASRLIRELHAKIRALRVKNIDPEVASEFGIDIKVKDPAAIAKVLKELEFESQRWRDWAQFPDLAEQVYGDDVDIQFSTADQGEVDLLLKRAGGDPKRALTLYQRQVATAANRGEPVATEQVDAMYRALAGDREQMDMFLDAPEPKKRTSRKPTAAQRPVQQSLENIDDDMLFSTVTNTPEFKRWFGKSKVVGESGTPLMVFHGTDAKEDITTFQRKYSRLVPGATRLGSFFTPSSKTAGFYSQGENSRIIPVFLSIKNPAFVTRRNFVDSTKDGNAVREYLETNGYDGIIFDALDSHGDYYAPQEKEIFDVLEGVRQTGLHGANTYSKPKGVPRIWDSAVEIVALYPNQVKSATGNKGTFDQADPDMLFSTAGEPQSLDEFKQQINAEIARRAAKTFAAGETPEGRPDLANPGTTQEARRAIDNLDQARTEAGRPEHIPREETDRAAREMIAVDREGVIAHIMEKGIAGEDLEDQNWRRAAKILFNEIVFQGIENGDTTEGMEFADAYRETASVWGRKGREMQEESNFDDPETRKMALLEHLYAPGKALERRIEKAKSRLRHKNATKQERKAASIHLSALRKMQVEQVNKRIEWVKRKGWDLSEEGFAAILKDEYQALAFLRDISTDRATFLDKLHEFRLAAMLSRPTTHAKNVVSSIANGAWELSFQRGMESAINTVLKDPDAASFGEFRYILRGLTSMDTWREVFQNTIDGAIEESDVVQRQHSAGGFEWGTNWADTHHGPAIKGRIGRMIRLPLRFLGGEDQFLKTLFARIEVSAQAYRIAKAEGKVGVEIDERIAELLEDPRSDAWKQAMAHATRFMFQDIGGEVEQATMALRDKTPGGRWVVPFARTPMSLFRTALRKAVFAPVAVAVDVHSGAKGDVRVRHMAESVYAIAFATGLAAYFLGDDDDYPLLTGANPPGGRSARYRTESYDIPVNSVRIGDEYWSYMEIEPFGSMLSLTITALEAFRDAKDGRSAVDAASSIVANFAATFLEHPFLRGIKDTIDSIDPNEPGNAGRFVANMVGSFVPNIAKAIPSSIDENVPDTRGMDFPKRMRRTVWPDESTAPPKVNIWGRMVAKGGNAVSRYANPYRHTKTIPKGLEKKMDRLIQNWNQYHFEDQYRPLPPSNVITHQGVKHKLTSLQWTRFKTLSGRYALEELSKKKLNYLRPREKDLDTVKAALTHSRKRAKAKLFPSWQ